MTPGRLPTPFPASSSSAPSVAVARSPAAEASLSWRPPRPSFAPTGAVSRVLGSPTSGTRSAPPRQETLRKGHVRAWQSQHSGPRGAEGGGLLAFNPPGSPRSAPGLTSSSERGGLSGGKARRSQHLLAPRELPPPSCRAEGGSFPRWGAGGGRKQCPGSRVRGGTSPGSCGLAGCGRGFPAPWCL